ncbi:hypothetical protein AVEN_226766-1 [Araneus ventricosus]|uniref:Uncharacterized protein n=1 Tax=Araneus ventricosus TaxID=182803 RepID=A0A4Y2JMA9_ARAVE|nr:hypothetical protein AVEN_226766-1 [Araneus ventricosus]
MGISNSCAKFSVSCFGWKKNKVFRRNKRDLTESIVRLRDDGSVGVDGLPTARIVPNRNHTWDYVFTRSEGKGNLGNLQPAVTQSLELVSIPSEDQFVKRPVDRHMEGHHFNIALISSLPPPIPPRKIERNVFSATLPIVDEQLSSDMAKHPSTEKSATSEDETCVQGNEAGKCDKIQEISTNICLYSEDSVKWATPKIPPRTFEIVSDGKAEVAEGTIAIDSDLTSVPPIPPRHH